MHRGIFLWSPHATARKLRAEKELYLLLQSYDRGPLLLQKAAVLPLHLPRHVGFLLECLQRILIAVSAKVIRDRLISGR